MRHNSPAPTPLTHTPPDAGTPPDAAQLAGRIAAAQAEIGKVIVGQQGMVNRLLMGLFTGGHILLEGVPGLAKTLTVSTLAQVLHLRFSRLQFTPDLLPADLVGTMMYNQAEARFFVRKGPIFAHIVLADEINRAPAKVQSALLECMQEKQVTIGDETFALEEPFFVLATQNPVDQEGTYPLPEAQMDRFLMKVLVEYPTPAEEKEIMRRMARTAPKPAAAPVLTRAEVLQIRQAVDAVRLDERLEDYIVALVAATRRPADYGLPALTPFIEFGVSPRATLALALAAKAHALLQGRGFVLPEDVKAIAPDVLRHRLLLTYEADAERITPDDCIRSLLEHMPI